MAGGATVTGQSSVASAGVRAPAKEGDAPVGPVVELPGVDPVPVRAQGLDVLPDRRARKAELVRDRLARHVLVPGLREEGEDELLRALLRVVLQSLGSAAMDAPESSGAGMGLSTARAHTTDAACSAPRAAR